MAAGNIHARMRRVDAGADQFDRTSCSAGAVTAVATFSTLTAFFAIAPGSTFTAGTSFLFFAVNHIACVSVSDIAAAFPVRATSFRIVFVIGSKFSVSPRGIKLGTGAKRNNTVGEDLKCSTPIAAVAAIAAGAAMAALAPLAAAATMTAVAAIRMVCVLVKHT